MMIDGNPLLEKEVAKEPDAETAQSKMLTPNNLTEIEECGLEVAVDVEQVQHHLHEGVQGVLACIEEYQLMAGRASNLRTDADCGIWRQTCRDG